MAQVMNWTAALNRSAILGIVVSHRYYRENNYDIQYLAHFLLILLIT